MTTVFAVYSFPNTRPFNVMDTSGRHIVNFKKQPFLHVISSFDTEFTFHWDYANHHRSLFAWLFSMNPSIYI